VCGSAVAVEGGVVYQTHRRDPLLCTAQPQPTSGMGVDSRRRVSTATKTTHRNVATGWELRLATTWINTWTNRETVRSALRGSQVSDSGHSSEVVECL
jgi:hypothetical protein